MTLLFATEPQEMRRELSRLRLLAAQTKLWVCWKKGKLAENGIGEEAGLGKPAWIWAWWTTRSVPSTKFGAACCLLPPSSAEPLLWKLNAAG